MDVNLLSRSYTVRRLDKVDIDVLFELMKKNTFFINTIHRLSQRKAF